MTSNSNLKTGVALLPTKRRILYMTYIMLLKMGSVYFSYNESTIASNLFKLTIVHSEVCVKRSAIN